MTDFRITYRYAEALLTAAEQQKALQEVSGDLAMIQRTTKESRELQLFLKSPIVKKERKQEVLEAMFSGKVHPLAFQFIRLLVEKDREGLLLQMIDTFNRLQVGRLGIIDISVNAAAPLTEEQKAKLSKRFEAYTGKKARLRFQIDKNLIGGFVARVEDVVLDGSVKRQLETIRRRFVEGRQAS